MSLASPVERHSLLERRYNRIFRVEDDMPNRKRRRIQKIFTIGGTVYGNRVFLIKDRRVLSETTIELDLDKYRFSKEIAYYQDKNNFEEWSRVTKVALGAHDIDELQESGKKLKQMSKCSSCGFQHRLREELGHFRCVRDLASRYQKANEVVVNRMCTHYSELNLPGTYEVTLIKYFLNYLKAPCWDCIKSVLLVPFGQSGYPDLSKSVVILNMYKSER